MNPWIWRLRHTNATTLTYTHSGRSFTIPRRLFASIPHMLTDSQVANLRALLSEPSHA